MPKSEQGVTNDRYMVIPRSLIFVIQGKRVLLLKGAPTKRLWANMYNGIGGHVERGEDVVTSARRELEEEAGLTGGEMRLCGTLMVDASDQAGIGIYIFRCDMPEGLELTPRPSPEGTLEWLPIDRLDEYPLVEDLKFILRKLFAMQPSDPPFSARSYYDSDDQLRLVFA